MAGTALTTASPISELAKTDVGEGQLTLVICSNRIANIRNHWQSYFDSLQPDDRLLVILDVAWDETVEQLESELTSFGIGVFVNGQNLGLSASRNVALDKCTTDFLVFIDDDVLVSDQTIDSIREELLKGTDIVGVRVVGPPKGLRLPWYITEGQLHYLAIHNPKSLTFTTWGACMALNVPFVRSTGLKFRPDLGRRGRGLQCGDDTTFLKQLRIRGAAETFLDKSSVIHNIGVERLSLRYLLCRSYWQGRAEFRRRDSINGVRKEWTRFLNSDARFPKKVLLASLYLASVAIGILRESLGSFDRR